jgi:glycosyltransferase involved in cell wall biosynthesis
VQNKKKILIFSTAYYPFVGGAEVAVKEITDRIPNAEFDLITARFKRSLPNKEKIGNVTVYRVGIGSPTLDKFLLPLLGVFYALRLQNKKKYEYFWCIMASFASGAAYLTNILKFWKPVPIVLTLQEGDSEKHFRTRWFGLINVSWRLALKRTSRVTAISTYLGNRAKKFGFKGDYRLISNGVNIRAFTEEISLEERERIRQELGFTNEDVILITTSRLVIKNGIGDVIKALPKLPENVKFVIFGEGNLENELKKLAEDLGVSSRIVFKGFVSQEYIPKYLKSCDIFIRPSLSEGMGNSFIEAFAAGLPVIATLVGGVADFLEDGVTGYVCSPENPQSVADTIERAIRDPERKKIIENAYRLAVGKYNWKNIALLMKADFGMPLTVAVVGGGIFGGTIAVKLAEAGIETHLFEREGELLQAASGINQYRLHRGYHYPRSISTALSSKYSEQSFRQEYEEAIIENIQHYYAIAREGSRVSGKEFLEFCDKCDLEHEEVTLDCLNEDILQLIIRGKESLINPLKLRELLNKNLKERHVQMHLNHTFTAEQINNFDFLVNATYANLNTLLEEEKTTRQYQFELCEKPVLKLPAIFQGKSIVILDGPFMCIDPYADTGFHVMGNVVHAIHATNTGLFPVVPEEFKPLLNKGVIKNPPITNIKKFIESASSFMPEIAKAEHIGSMFTIRTVLPNVDATDERPTLVTRVSEDVINIFSGKIGNCMEAALQVLNLVQNG